MPSLTGRYLLCCLKKMGYLLDYNNDKEILREIAQVIEGVNQREEKDSLEDYTKITQRIFGRCMRGKRRRPLQSFHLN